MSSDSEDDCYGNIAKNLQKMKNNFKGDTIDTLKLLNDSLDPNEATPDPNSTTKDEDEWPQLSLENIAQPSVSTETDPIQEIAVKSTSKRKTRSAAKKSSSPDPILELPLSRRRRGVGRGRTTGRGRIATPSPNRGRSRGRGSRNRNTLANFLQAVIPTYSIGDADEVPDHSEGQVLFSNQKQPEIVVVEEYDPLDDNEELSVKVYWQSCKFFRFKIRRYQKLAQIFDFFSKENSVSQDKLLFTYKEKILQPEDTPDSIDYNIAKFIDGGVVNQSVSQIVMKNEKIKDGISIKFQCQNVKKPFEFTVRPDDKLSVTMTKCAEHLEIPLSKLRFEFDGDCISGKTSARELELEGGECIDVKVIS